MRHPNQTIPVAPKQRLMPRMSQRFGCPRAKAITVGDTKIKSPTNIMSRRLDSLMMQPLLALIEKQSSPVLTYFAVLDVFERDFHKSPH
jgi:hypothetical protein